MKYSGLTGALLASQLHTSCFISHKVLAAMLKHIRMHICMYMEYMEYLRGGVSYVVIGYHCIATC